MSSGLSNKEELVALQLAAAAINMKNWDDISNALLTTKANQADLTATNAKVTSNTAAIIANATAIANVGNGAPKGAFATLSALQAAFPTGAVGPYIVSADGKWYYWSGSAWTAGGVYQSTGIADGSVGEASTSFLRKSAKNLLRIPAGSVTGNGITVTCDGTIVTVTGTSTDTAIVNFLQMQISNSYLTGWFTPAIALASLGSLTYSASNLSGTPNASVTFALRTSKNGTFPSGQGVLPFGISAFSGTRSSTGVPTDDVSFAYLTMPTGTVCNFSFSLQLEVGSVPTSYERPYLAPAKSIPSDSLLDGIVTNSKLAASSVDGTKVTSDIMLAKNSVARTNSWNNVIYNGNFTAGTDGYKVFVTAAMAIDGNGHLRLTSGASSGGQFLVDQAKTIMPTDQTHRYHVRIKGIADGLTANMNISMGFYNTSDNLNISAPGVTLKLNDVIDYSYLFTVPASFATSVLKVFLFLNNANVGYITLNSITILDLGIQSAGLSTYNLADNALRSGLDYIGGYFSGPAAVVDKSMSSLSGGDTSISAWGDSLTHGSQDGTGVSYTSVLATLSGKNVTNYGVGGETAATIMGRHGSLPMMVQPSFTIPAGTTPVTITLLSHNGDAVAPLVQSAGEEKGINPCSINGIVGTLSYSAGTYSFTRTAAGTATTISRPAPLLTNASNVRRTDGTLLLWIGTNDIPATPDNDFYDKLIANYKLMLEYGNNCSKFLIISMIEGNISKWAAYHYKLANAFGRHFINAHKYLVNYGLQDAGITPTTQDTTDVSNGKVPTSLRYDGLHLNAAGYTVLGTHVYQRGQELKYW